MNIVLSIPIWDADENQGYFSHRFISECLDQTIGDFVLVAVDNNSTYSHTIDYLDHLASIKHPKFKLIRNKKNLGYAKAANQGIQWGMAHGAQFGIIMNNDIILNERETWLQDFLAPLRENPQQLLGARLIADNGMTNIDGNGCIPYLEGWMLGFDRSLLDVIGRTPFDPKFHSYWEDVDLSVRATMANFPIVQSDCFKWESDGNLSVARFIGGVVFHAGGSSGYLRKDFSPQFSPDYNFATVTNQSRDYFIKKWGLVPQT